MLFHAERLAGGRRFAGLPSVASDGGNSLRLDGSQLVVRCGGVFASDFVVVLLRNINVKQSINSFHVGLSWINFFWQNMDG